MKFLATAFALFAQFQGFNAQLDSSGISLPEKVETMERLMVGFGNAFDFAVTPCIHFHDGDPLTGHQTAAEWLRILFHDFVTADVAAGTGGLDASIGYEWQREENKGIFFVNVTLQFENTFFSAFTSMSDMIGLGVAVSLASCDTTARQMKLKVGRKDALVAGPFGVPGPADPLSVALAAFAKAGFSQTEAIQSVACGHSIGAVNRRDHPEIVPLSVVSPTNLHGNSAFDSTKGVFDHTVVNEYLTQTGKKGGPLVVGLNTTTNSDKRLYLSDNNVAITALNSETNFRNKCFTLFEKMMDTVPSGSSLSAPVVPRPWFLLKGFLDLSSTGAVSYQGTINGLSATGTPPATAAYQYTTVGGGNTGPLSVPFTASFNRFGFGNVRQYNFNNVLNSPNIIGLNVGTYTKSINNKIFPLLPQTWMKEGAAPGGGHQILVRAAILSSLSTETSQPVATFYHSRSQVVLNTVMPKLVSTSGTLTYWKTQGTYRIFQGVINMAAGDPGNGGRTLGVDLGTTLKSERLVSTFISPFLTQTCTEANIFDC